MRRVAARVEHAEECALRHAVIIRLARTSRRAGIDRATRGLTGGLSRGRADAAVASIAEGCSGLNATAVGQIAVGSWSFGRTTTYGESDAADCQHSKDTWIHQGPIHRFPVFPFVFFQYLARRLGCKRPKSYSQFSYGLRHTSRILNIIVRRTAWR